MNSIQFKTSELLMFYSSCDGDQVSIVMRYEADAYCFKKLHSKYELNTT